MRQFNEVINKNGNKNAKYVQEESYLESVINPSFSGNDELLSDGEVQTVETSAEERMNALDDQDAFDITRVPFTLQPRTQLYASTLSELSKKVEQTAARVKAEDESTINKVVVPSSMTKNNSDYIDITQLKFSPVRKSLLTDMLNKERSTTTRDPFQRVLTRPPVVPRARPASNDEKSVMALTCIAPAGKLGVVVDENGCVSSINNNSPLVGQLLLGDMIVAVDDIDVEQLVDHDVVSVLLSRSAAMRKITVLREVNDLQDDIGIQLSPSYSERFDEVEEWVLSYLPRLQPDDCYKYTSCLIEDGFDSLDMLGELIDDDLYFMRKAHRRVMSRKLSELNTKSRPLPSESSSSDYQPPMPAKKVYTVEEALGKAARKGIEATIAEEKRQRQMAKEKQMPTKDVKEAEKRPYRSVKKKTRIDPMREGITAEEAERIRMTRLALADEEAAQR